MLSGLANPSREIFFGWTPMNFHVRNKRNLEHAFLFAFVGSDMKEFNGGVQVDNYLFLNSVIFNIRRAYVCGRDLLLDALKSFITE